MMRECGECTMCCKELELHTIASSIGELCRYCTVGVGCQIYEERPGECKQYQCMWTQMENVSEDLRPDRCGVIFDRAGDDVITGRLSEGREISELLKGQIETFMSEGFSVVLFSGAKKLSYMQEKHNKNYVIGVISDRSQLH
jgi:hypothetical protein